MLRMERLTILTIHYLIKFLKQNEIRSKNIPLIFIATFFGGILFFLPILALYLEENLFSITNVTIIFSVRAISSVILEIPTGAIGDLFGRKKTLILDYLFTFGALTFLYIGGNIWMFVLYAIFDAIGSSLNSGTESAMLYDSLKEEGKEYYYKKIAGINNALWSFGASVGSIVGGFIAKIQLDLTIFYTAIPILISFIFILFTEEPKYHKEEKKNIFLHSLSSFKT
ncbi:MFS transporter, partial [Candidatus Peregrinibacteria bacterium]|nr:MFS transporter [Candidatus Peregrinibacteria bacterium]